MDHQLVVLKGRSANSTVQLADGVTTAGRQEGCELRVKSSEVSRKHCQFFEKNGMLIVKDLGSSNGTFVNGERIQGQRVLEPGDEVALGPITFRVEKTGVSAAAAPVPAVGKGPGDTAITGTAPAAAAPVSDDEFEIIFDDDPSEAPAPAPAPAPAAAAGGGSLASARKPAPAPAPPPEPEPEPAASADMGDDAVADFLLDLKTDEDD